MLNDCIQAFPSLRLVGVFLDLLYASFKAGSIFGFVV